MYMYVCIHESVTGVDQLWPEVGSVGAEQHPGTQRHPAPQFPAMEAATEEEEEDKKEGDVPGGGVGGRVEWRRGVLITAVWWKRVPGILGSWMFICLCVFTTWHDWRCHRSNAGAQQHPPAKGKKNFIDPTVGKLYLLVPAPTLSNFL